ncbi:MAG: integration host factor subunit alpha [Rhodospirillaceae bacterium]|nr:integration host factor subunit alpha [Rhodospirillaceae bacterium]
MSRTMTRAQLSESIYQEVGLSRNESAELLEMVLEEISAALVRGEAVKISSFGSFSVRQKGERIGRNPKTGEEVPIRPRKVLVFRASQLLKARIRGEKISADADRDLDIPDAQPPSGYSSSVIDKIREEIGE